MVCVALFSAWYTERCRFISLDSSWNSERKRLVHAGMLLGENNLSVNLDDGIAELVVVPELGDLPGVTKDGLNLHRTDNASKNLILLVNLEQDFRKILLLETKSELAADSHYHNIAYDIWSDAGKPQFGSLDKFAQTSTSITIERPAELKLLIQKLTTDPRITGLSPPMPNLPGLQPAPPKDGNWFINWGIVAPTKPLDNRTLIRSGEAPAVGRSR